MNIQGFQKTTLLDYPKHVAATVFTGGCNFRCPFCHNKDLVILPHLTAAYSEDDILLFLKKRCGILDGLCITGGEPLLQPDLRDFLDKVKSLGLSVKLDTNGYEPGRLKELCRLGLVDYVAMDIKGSPGSYERIAGLHGLDMQRIYESVDFLLGEDLDYEFRTTVVKELHKREDFRKISDWIAGAKAYYLQAYQESPQVLSPGFSSYSRFELEDFLCILKPHVPAAQLRGVDD